MFWARLIIIIIIKSEEDLHVSDYRIQVDLQNVLGFQFFIFFHTPQEMIRNWEPKKKQLLGGLHQQLVSGLEGRVDVG